MQSGINFFFKCGLIVRVKYGATILILLIGVHPHDIDLVGIMAILGEIVIGSTDFITINNLLTRILCPYRDYILT